MWPSGHQVGKNPNACHHPSGILCRESLCTTEHGSFAQRTCNAVLLGWPGDVNAMLGLYKPDQLSDSSGTLRLLETLGGCEVLPPEVLPPTSSQWRAVSLSVPVEFPFPHKSQAPALVSYHLDCLTFKQRYLSGYLKVCCILVPIWNIPASQIISVASIKLRNNCAIRILISLIKLLLLYSW